MADKRLQNLRPFKKGESGNPGGKPDGARNRLTAKFLHELAEHFENNGKKAIGKLYEQDPAKYVTIVASLVPAEKNVSVNGNHEHTHKHVAVSDTAAWLSEVLGERANRPPSKPLPN
jgi:hypothetical protein